MENKNCNFEKSLILYFDANLLSKSDNLSKDFKVILEKFENLTADIYSSHNFFNNFPENTFLFHIFNLIVDYNITKTNNLASFLKATTNLIEDLLSKKQFTTEEIFISIILLLHLYLKESIFGPSFFFLKETEKVDLKDDIHLFDNSKFKSIHQKFSCEDIKNEIIDYLTIGGEIPYNHSKLTIFFVITHNALMNTKLFDMFSILPLWKARIGFLHNKLVKEPVNDLKELIFTNMELFKKEHKNKILSNENEETRQKISSLLKIEESYYALRFYRYKESEELLESAREELKLKIELTGRLGRLTKYQEFDSAILVVDTKSSTLTNKVEVKTDDNLEFEDPNEVKKVLLDDLDKQNPLLEKPNFTDDKFLNSTELSVHDQLYVCGLLNLLRKSYPDEDLLRSIINAYISKSIEKSLDWLVYSRLLIFKSFNEDKRTKTVERSLVQIQSICEQFNDRKPNTYARFKFYFSTDYPYIWELKKQYAQMYMQFGAVLTAFEIFKELEMNEECIQCLYVAGKNEAALEFANTMLKKKEEPGIYCVLGEIQNNVEHFFKAIEISNGSYTRAYRCLGRFYFLLKE